MSRRHPFIRDNQDRCHTCGEPEYHDNHGEVRPAVPWRDPKESTRALEQRARNDGKRPECKHCGAELRAFTHYHWPIQQQFADYRWIDGYGDMGRGLFCSKSCAIRHAYVLYRNDEVKGDV